VFPTVAAKSSTTRGPSLAATVLAMRAVGAATATAAISPGVTPAASSAPFQASAPSCE
jgi:hypothetical protein